METTGVPVWVTGGVLVVVEKEEEEEVDVVDITWALLATVAASVTGMPGGRTI